MRFHSKTCVKFLSILTGAMIGSLIYTAQNGGTIKHRTDRFADLESIQSHHLNLDHGMDISFLGKEQQIDQILEEEEEEQKTKPHDLKSFVTIKPKSPELHFRINKNFKFSTCQSSLQHKLQKHSWSSRFYHPAVQMIMTKAHVNEEEYDRLKPYNMPFGFRYKDKLTFEEISMILKLFSVEESIFHFSEYERPSCLSCAIVGNGGMLNGSGMGQEIDAHDMVFRVNNCIRRGYEKDVGNRTTHYVFMDRSLIFTKSEDVPQDPGMRWIFLPCRKNDYTYISSVAKALNPKQKLKAKAEDIRILHPDFVRYIHKVWMHTKSFRPSTGGMMFMTALHAGCDRLSVYGMGFNKVYSEHYYDTSFKTYRNVKGSHDFAREIEILKELDKANIIKWYKRDVPEFLSDS